MATTLILRPAALLATNFPLKSKFLLSIFWAAIFLAIISLVGLYVFQITGQTSAVYAIQKYEKRAEGLSKENKALEISSVEADSLNNILSNITLLGFEKVGKYQYIKVINNQVVQNK